jgi:hypothetical protein
MSLQHASENTMSDTAMLRHTCRNEVTGTDYPSSSSSFFTLFILSICKSVSFVRTILFSCPTSVVSQRLYFTTGALRTDGQVTTALHVDVTCELRTDFKKTLQKLSYFKKTLQKLSYFKKTRQKLSYFKKTLQKISYFKKTLQKLSYFKKTLQKLSYFKKTLQKLSYFKKTLQKLSSIGLQKQTHISVYMEVF